jgi:hypothetical protein
MLKVRSDGGFFSTCSVRLMALLQYFNKNSQLPSAVDSSEQFTWYKKNLLEDITFRYFIHYDDIPVEIKWVSHILHYDRQFDNYKEIDYGQVCPFIKKYFTPTPSIYEEAERIASEYFLDYESTCVLFYRGNDKITEVSLCTYDDMIEKAHEILSENPGIRFLIQSDETEFIHRMLEEFPTSIWFEKEVRHISQQMGTVDLLLKDNIESFSKKFLAITLLMSRCKYVVCGTGNCSLWISYYRGHADGMYQYLHDGWV